MSGLVHFPDNWSRLVGILPLLDKDHHVLPGRPSHLLSPGSIAQTLCGLSNAPNDPDVRLWVYLLDEAVTGQVVRAWSAVTCDRCRELFAVWYLVNREMFVPEE